MQLHPYRLVRTPYDRCSLLPRSRHESTTHQVRHRARTLRLQSAPQARYRCGIAWRDLPEVFGLWQTVWQRHKRMADDGTWDLVQQRLHEQADRAGLIDWNLSVDSTIVRAHQHATNVTRLKKGFIELQESADRAA